MVIASGVLKLIVVLIEIAAKTVAVCVHMIKCQLTRDQVSIGHLSERCSRNVDVIEGPCLVQRCSHEEVGQRVHCYCSHLHSRGSHVRGSCVWTT